MNCQECEKYHKDRFNNCQIKGISSLSGCHTEREVTAMLEIKL